MTSTSPREYETKWKIFFDGSDEAQHHLSKPMKLFNNRLNEKTQARQQ